MTLHAYLYAIKCTESVISWIINIYTNFKHNIIFTLGQGRPQEFFYGSKLFRG